ncbi:hypothetical protein HDV01_007261 [Terramyces sp. JEL0728]|nr:hypothetical protein HDV01_007261 [Terramyces sp. JEL0728]
MFQRCTQLFSGLNRIFCLVFTNCFHMSKSREEQDVWVQMQKADPRFMEMFSFCEKRVVFIENPPYDACADEQELCFDTVNVQESKASLDQLLYAIDAKVALTDIEINQEFVSNSSTPKIGFIIHTDDFQSRPASPLYDRRAFDVELKPETLVNSPRMDGYGINVRPYESLPSSPYNAPRPIIKSKTPIDRNLKLPSIRSIDGLNQLSGLAPPLHGSMHSSPIVNRTPIPRNYSLSPKMGTPSNQNRDESAAASLMTFKNSKYDGHSSDESQEVIPSKKRPPPDNVQLSYKGKTTGSKRGRQNHTYKQNELLKDWMQAHRSNPYPSEEEKIQLMKETGLTLMQVNTWFINARRRFLIKSVPTKEIPDETTEQMLLQWMLENLSNPFPDEDTKEEMCGKRRWEKNNLNAWLAFVRKKHLLMIDGIWERVKESK